MTMPDERYRALLKTHQFLRDLLDPKKTPKVPKAIRQMASNCLRHHPGEFYLSEIAKLDKKGKVLKETR